VKCLVRVEEGLLLFEELLSVFDYISGCLKMIAVVWGELSTESLTKGSCSCCFGLEIACTVYYVKVQCTELTLFDFKEIGLVNPQVVAVIPKA
jgi:hypothetical protein